MRVADEDQYTIPHAFTIRRATPLRQLPARNSTPYAYGEVTLSDLPGWITNHLTSRMSRWKMADVTLETQAVPRVVYLHGHYPQEECERLLVTALQTSELQLGD